MPGSKESSYPYRFEAESNDAALITAAFFKKYCGTTEQVDALVEADIITEDERELVNLGANPDAYKANPEIGRLHEVIKEHLGVEDPKPGDEVDYEKNAL